MRTPRAVNSLIDNLFERKYRKAGQEKKRIWIFFSSGFCFNIVTPGTGSKYREFYDLSGRITCMILGKDELMTLSPFKALYYYSKLMGNIKKFDSYAC